MILTDANYVILTLLRSHRDDDKGLAIMARHAYPVHAIRLRTALSEAQLDAALAAADDKQTLRGAVVSLSRWHSLPGHGVLGRLELQNVRRNQGRRQGPACL